MNKQNNQSGSAHIPIIVIILTIALLGALGFVYYQNFILKKEVLIKNSDISTAKAEDNSFNLFTFDHPDIGWKIKADTFNGIEDKDYVSLESDDYKSGPMGAEAGSSIGIGEDKDLTDIVGTIDYYKSKNMISNLSTITVDGQTAYKYLFSYEFGYYNTLFSKNGKNYQVMLDGPNDESLKVYDKVLETLKVK